MLCITALLFGLFGWKKRNCASRTSTAPSIPDQASNPYSGLSPFEVAALFRRLAEAQAQRQVPAASSLHVESSAASGSTHLDCASWEDDSCTRKLAAVSSLPGEASTASRSEHSAPACWEDDSICSGRSDSGACGSLSSVGSSSGGSGEPHCAPCASRSTQEAEPMPAKACSGFPPLPELPDSACSAQLHSSARTCQAALPWYHRADLLRHTVVRRLGCGAYGSVTLASVELGDGSTRQMAVKSLFKVGSPDSLLKVAQREVQGMQAMQGCPHAIQLYGTSSDHLSGEERTQPQPSYELFMEAAEGTLTKELEAAVRAKPRCEGGRREGLLLPVLRVAEVAYVLLSALTHMNSRGFAHCDVKTDNIFVMADGTFRLGDPGVASAADASGVLEHAAGSLYYCSPEMSARLRDQPCRYPVTLKSDMYSVARALALSAVWYDEMMSWEHYVRWERDLPDCVPAGLRQLIASMVEEDPAKRPTPLEALDNPWLVGVLRGEEQQQRQQEALWERPALFYLLNIFIHEEPAKALH